MSMLSNNSPNSPLCPPPSRDYIAKARASPPKKLAPLVLPSADRDTGDDATNVPRGKIEMQPALLAEFAGLIDAIGPAICQLLPGEAGLAKCLQHIFKAVVDAAGGSLEAVICLLKELSTGHLFDGIKHFLSNIATTVGCTLDQVYQAVQALLGGVEDLTGSIGEIVECILKNVGELLSEIKKGVVALLKSILPTKLFASIEALVGGILREVSNLVDLRCLFSRSTSASSRLHKRMPLTALLILLTVLEQPAERADLEFRLSRLEQQMAGLRSQLHSEREAAQRQRRLSEAFPQTDEEVATFEMMGERSRMSFGALGHASSVLLEHVAPRLLAVNGTIDLSDDVLLGGVSLIQLLAGCQCVP